MVNLVQLVMGFELIFIIGINFISGLLFMILFNSSISIGISSYTFITVQTGLRDVLQQFDIQVDMEMYYILVYNK